MVCGPGSENEALRAAAVDSEDEAVVISTAFSSCANVRRRLIFAPVAKAVGDDYGVVQGVDCGYVDPGRIATGKAAILGKRSVTINGSRWAHAPDVRRTVVLEVCRADLLGVRYLRDSDSSGGDTREDGRDAHRPSRPRLAACGGHIMLPSFLPWLERSRRLASPARSTCAIPTMRALDACGDPVMMSQRLAMDVRRMSTCAESSPASSPSLRRCAPRSRRSRPRSTSICQAYSWMQGSEASGVRPNALGLRVPGMPDSGHRDQVG